MGSLSPWHWAIIIVVLLLLFGAKKLPDFARSLGKSARILKEETKQFRDEGNSGSTGQQAAPQQPTQQLPQAPPPSTTHTSEAQVAPPIEQQRQTPHSNNG